MTFGSQFVIWMHLYRQILCGIDKLDKQGELVAIALIKFLTHYLPAVCRKKLGKGFTLERPVGNNRLMTRHRAKFPRFTHMVALRGDSFELGNTLATPKHRFENRLEAEYW